MPGTSTCIKIGGVINATVAYQQRFTMTGNRDTLDARWQPNIDVRDQTEFGLLRAYAHLRFNNNAVSTPDSVAFIQFGGLTAGIAPSFFAKTASYGAINGIVGRSDHNAPLVAWTQSLGGGLSATLSLENSNTNRPAGGATAAIDAARDTLLDPMLTLAYKQGDIGVGASIVAHENGNNPGEAREWGWATGAAVTVDNLFGKGSGLSIGGQYANGAVGYVDFASTSNNHSGGAAGAFIAANFFDNQGTAITVADVNAANQTATAWGVQGAVKVPFSAKVFGYAAAGYAHYEPAGSAGTMKVAGYQAGVTWTPSAGFTISPEYRYLTVNSTLTGMGTGGTEGRHYFGTRIARAF